MVFLDSQWFESLLEEVKCYFINPQGICWNALASGCHSSPHRFLRAFDAVEHNLRSNTSKARACMVARLPRPKTVVQNDIQTQFKATTSKLPDYFVNPAITLTKLFGGRLRSVQLMHPFIVGETHGAVFVL
jgi:hypothetical protein